ncbi:MAG: hypothetical protein U0574_06910 [Phycisphaerales bacterium]
MKKRIPLIVAAAAAAFTAMALTGCGGEGGSAVKPVTPKAVVPADQKITPGGPPKLGAREGSDQGPKDAPKKN